MNDNTRMLIRYVCDGDLKGAQSQADIILKKEGTKKDAQFCESMIRKLEAHRLIELPYNLKELLIAENSDLFPERKFLVSEKDSAVTTEILQLFNAAGRLSGMGIPYLPAAIFYGESGCGKTELARYVAHKANLPFIYVRFSNVVSSYLGSTQSNIGKIFEYARKTPCVLCFDEIDAVGMCRGQKNDVGEMNRIVIALMQELDRMPNNVIIIGTTNRYDRLDPALIRRFPIQHEILPLDMNDAIAMASLFFQYAGVSEAVPSEWYDNLENEMDGLRIPASRVVKLCTDTVVSLVVDGKV